MTALRKAPMPEAALVWPISDLSDVMPQDRGLAVFPIGHNTDKARSCEQNGEEEENQKKGAKKRGPTGSLHGDGNTLQLRLVAARRARAVP
jgi:hypothetical protein